MSAVPAISHFGSLRHVKASLDGTGGLVPHRASGVGDSGASYWNERLAWKDRIRSGLWPAMMSTSIVVSSLANTLENPR